MTTIETITELVNYYGKHYSEMLIVPLMNLKDKLLAHSYLLAEEVAVSKSQYNEAVFIKKIEALRSRQNMRKRDERMTETRLKDESDFDTIDKLQIELQAEALTYKYDLLLRQANKVSDAISQRIAFMRNEK